MPTNNKTSNYGLNQWDGNEYPKREDFVNDNAKIDAALSDCSSVVNASGTATNVLINIPSILTLRAGLKITFLASHNNNGALTSINLNDLGAKNLYKPGTEVSPKLVAGKAYDIWFNGTSFFLKASAEGNAQAHHVLAPYTISNDDDTGIEGTMPNRGEVQVIPSDNEQNFSDGYYVGITVLPRPTLAGDADVAHVLAGKKFYSNNYTVKTGTMVDRAGDTAAVSLSRSGTTIKLRATAGFRDGTNDFVTHTDVNDIPSHIKKDVNIRGTVGTLEDLSLSRNNMNKYNMEPNISNPWYKYISENGLLSILDCLSIRDQGKIRKKTYNSAGTLLSTNDNFVTGLSITGDKTAALGRRGVIFIGASGSGREVNYDGTMLFEFNSVCSYGVRLTNGCLVHAGGGSQSYLQYRNPSNTTLNTVNAPSNNTFIPVTNFFIQTSNTTAYMLSIDTTYNQLNLNKLTFNASSMSLTTELSNNLSLTSLFHSLMIINQSF